MREFDFAIGWPVSEEKEHLFVKTLESECSLRGMSFLFIDEKNSDEIASEIQKDKAKIKFYLDMASEIYDADNKFTRLAYILKDSGARIVDDPDDVKAAADKSVTHFDLVRSGIPVPYTVVIRNWEPTRRLTEEEKEGLGFPFVIKPAQGYGRKGVKVIKERSTLKEIAEARKFNKGDNFLLQEFIEPKDLDEWPAWFRVYHLFGEILPCWWNHQTNVYRQLTLKDLDTYKLTPLARITSEIARITRVDWFSTEIAVNKKDKQFVVIDYVNDQCAVTPQSEAKDGVPDDVIALIANRIAEKAWFYIKGKFTLTNRAVWFPKIQVKDENA